MLILPPGHGREVASRRRLGRRERYLLGIVASASALLLAGVLVAVVLSAGASGSAGGRCVNLTIASSLGGQPIRRCGAAGRALCASVDRPGGYSGQPGLDIATRCRQLGIAVR